jgi:cellulose synthase operon protein YhjQ
MGLHLGLEINETGGLAREGVRRSTMFQSPFGLRFIPFGRLTVDELPEFAAHLRSNPRWLADSLAALPAPDFDYVIVDTPPGPTPYLRQALQAAHLAPAVVLADAASYASLPQLMEMVDEYTQGRNDFRGVFPVVNQMTLGGRLGHQVRSAMAADYGGRMAPVTVHRDTRVPHAFASERPVLEYDPAAMASLDIEHLTDWLVESVNH